MEKVTVIVTAYNQQNLIERCVDSILKQTYENLQIIVINDGSTDLTEKILYDKYCENKKITLINQENKGCSKSRNLGIEYANGKYVTFVDGDDYLLPNSVEILVDYMLNDTKNSMVQGCFQNQKHKKKITPNACAKLFKTKIIKEKKINFPENSHMGEDFSFVEKYTIVSGETIFCPEEVYFYDQSNPDSASKNIEKRFEIYKSLNDIIDFANKNEVDIAGNFSGKFLHHGFVCVFGSILTTCEKKQILHYYISMMRNFYNIRKFIKIRHKILVPVYTIALLYKYW